MGGAVFTAPCRSASQAGQLVCRKSPTVLLCASISRGRRGPVQHGLIANRNNIICVCVCARARMGVIWWGTGKDGGGDMSPSYFWQ